MTVADEKRIVEDQRRALDEEIADFQRRKAQVILISHWSMLLILASHWSQVLKFILRPQPHLRALLQATEEHFNHPIVGVHIRRTDKVALMNEEWKMDSDIVTRLAQRQHSTLWRSTWLTCWNGSGSRD